MTEKFFTQKATLLRMADGVLGPHLAAVAKTLDEEQYSTATIRRHLRAVDRFGAWLKEKAIPVADVSETTVGTYIQGLSRRRSKYRSSGHLSQFALGLYRLVDILRQAGALTAAHSAPIPQTSALKWLDQFDNHLDHVAGCAFRSRDNYLRYARRLLQEVFGDAEVDWSVLTASVITDFVRREAAKLKPSACGQPVTAVRSLIRFLASQGAVSAGLAGAVPPVRTWRHASLPRTISAAEVERALAACDSQSEYGLREQAVVLLLARLGIRAGEVIRLRIDDIDWVRGCVLVRAGKTHRERSLPLSQEVGDALVLYLRQSRPVSPHRELFLRWLPPFRPLCKSVSICVLVQKVLKRAGISVHRPGAHVFRHTLATELANNGGTFKAIADVLGHGSIASTEIYAKLNLSSLSQVAMPWPGGAK